MPVFILKLKDGFPQSDLCLNLSFLVNHILILLLFERLQL